MTRVLLKGSLGVLKRRKRPIEGWDALAKPAEVLILFFRNNDKPNGDARARLRLKGRPVTGKENRSANSATLKKREAKKAVKDLKTNKTAKRSDLAPIRISMAYATPRETFRFAWRIEGFVSPVFGFVQARSATAPVGRPSSPFGASDRGWKIAAKKLRESAPKVLQSLSFVTLCAGLASRRPAASGLGPRGGNPKPPQPNVERARAAVGPAGLFEAQHDRTQVRLAQPMGSEPAQHAALLAKAPGSSRGPPLPVTTMTSRAPRACAWRRKPRSA